MEEPVAEAELNGELADGDGVAAPPKKKTRRGSRGGRGRKRPATAAATADRAEANGEPETHEPAPQSEPERKPEQAAKPEPVAEPAGGDWGYVPMSQWEDDLRPGSTE